MDFMSLFLGCTAGTTAIGVVVVSGIVCVSFCLCWRRALERPMSPWSSFSTDPSMTNGFQSGRSSRSLYLLVFFLLDVLCKLEIFGNLRCLKSFFAVYFIEDNQSEFVSFSWTVWNGPSR